jgi:hypothetical protein
MLYTIGNALLIFGISRLLSTSDFGRVGLIYGLLVITVGGFRSLLAEPAFFERDPWLSTKSATRTAIFASLVGVAVFLVSSLSWGPATSTELALVYSLPGVVTHEVLRQRLLRAFVISPVLAGDAVWLCFVSGGLVLAQGSAAFVAISWSIGSYVALCSVVLGSVGQWGAGPVRLGWSYFAEFAIIRSTAELLAVMIAVFATLEEAGSFRLALMALGVPAVLNQGVRTLALRAAGSCEDIDRLLPMMVKYSGIGVVLATLGTVGVLAVPDDLMERISGPSWQGAEIYVLLLGISRVAAAAGIGGFAGLRRIGADRASVRSRAMGAAIALAGVATGFGVQGANGAALGLSVGTVVTAILFWWSLRRAEPTPRSIMGD